LELLCAAIAAAVHESESAGGAEGQKSYVECHYEMDGCYEDSVINGKCDDQEEEGMSDEALLMFFLLWEDPFRLKLQRTYVRLEFGCDDSYSTPERIHE